MNPTVTRLRLLFILGTIFILSSGYFTYSGLTHAVRPPPFIAADPLPHLSEYLHISTAAGGPSAPWAPMSLARCEFGMPGHYAPCVAEHLSNVAYAEELLYPDFQIREPYFVKEEHRNKWRQATLEITDRAVFDSGWMVYKGQTGQNFVFNDVQYTWSSSHFDTWSPEACMSSLVSTSYIQPIVNKSEATPILPIVTVAVSPDSYSFQHHLDRVTHIIGQGAHLLYGSNSTSFVVTGRQGSRTVQRLWELLGYDKDHVLYKEEEVKAETMLFSCRAVLIHPWLSLKVLEMFGIEHNDDVDPGTRKQVIYMSRSDGRTNNPGRRVLNEADVLAGIRELLSQRNRSEELVVFNPDEYETPDQLFSWFSKNVAAVIGPHGGAMMNHRWAARGTLVVEMMPSTNVPMMIFEEASVLSQKYAAIVAEPVGADMVVDVEDILSLLRAYLGVVEEDPLRKSYHWRAKELELDADT
ncbi:hypothetical protein B0H11DRAFT_2028904 [Mycena galericulata]|nr:hypothetical protein B0H11DRAFT_2028904 [Mycena galericulata]